MLKHGVLDADIYPEKATVIIDMLWSVTSNSSARVSACNNSPMCTSRTCCVDGFDAAAVSVTVVQRNLQHLN